MCCMISVLAHFSDQQSAAGHESALCHHVVGMLNNTRVRSREFTCFAPILQWPHISYVLLFFLSCPQLTFFILEANIFGTEQDRVNCSFYYKVCDFLSQLSLAR